VSADEMLMADRIARRFAKQGGYEGKTRVYTDEEIESNRIRRERIEAAAEVSHHPLASPTDVQDMVEAAVAKAMKEWRQENG